MKYWGGNDTPVPVLNLMRVLVRRLETKFNCTRIWDTRSQQFVSFSEALELSSSEYHEMRSTQFRSDIMFKAARHWYQSGLLPSRFVPEHLADKEACTYADHKWGLTLTGGGQAKIVCLDPCDEPICREHSNGGRAYSMEVSACFEPIDIELCETAGPLPITLEFFSDSDDYWGFVVKEQK